MTGKGLLAAVVTGRQAPRIPYVPILGHVAHVLGQVSDSLFRTDAQAQATALADTATAMGADVVTVGYETDPAVGVDVVERLRPLLAGRGLAAVLHEPDMAGVRAYCEAGVGLILLIEPDRTNASKFKTIANACSFYEAAALLVDSQVSDAATVAAELNLHGAVVAEPRSDSPGIVGGALSASHATGVEPVAPRTVSFFWSFPTEVPPDLSPEDLAALGRRLTAG